MSVDPDQQTKVLDFIAGNPVGVISTVSIEGKPWGSPVYVIADELLHFYFVTRSSTAKYENLKNNPTVALTVVNSDSQQAVQLSGEVTEIPHGEHKHRLLQRIMQAHPDGAGEGWLPPVAKLESGTYAMCQVTPRHLQFVDFSDAAPPTAGHIQPIIPR